MLQSAYTSILEGHLQILEKTGEGLALRESAGPGEDTVWKEGQVHHLRSCVSAMRS